MSADFAELLTIGSPLLTPEDVRPHLTGLTDEAGDGYLAALIDAATEKVAADSGYQLRHERWHVPEDSLRHYSPRTIVAIRDGGFEIEVGFVPQALPDAFRKALVHYVAWAWDHRDRIRADPPSYGHLHGALEERAAA